MLENVMRGDRFGANSEIRCPFTERLRSGVHENISRQLIELAVKKNITPARHIATFVSSLKRGTKKPRQCFVVREWNCV